MALTLGFLLALLKALTRRQFSQKKAGGSA
jgi:hypothetical protein